MSKNTYNTANQLNMRPSLQPANSAKYEQIQVTAKYEQIQVRKINKRSFKNPNCWSTKPLKEAPHLSYFQVNNINRSK